MSFERYKTFTVEDFMFDRVFRELVRNADIDDGLKVLLKSLPEKKYEINMALILIKGLNVPKFEQSSDRKKELWQKIINKQRKQVKFTFMKYAAAIILLLGTTSTFYFLSKRIDNSEFVTNNSYTEFVNNSNDAILVLGNGKSFSISSTESTVKYSTDGSEITVNNSSGVGKNVKGGGLNKMIVPFGKRSVITLSDGTKVWINSGSTLIFPAVFDDKTREVELIGEAFFDVKQNEDKPFLVKTEAFKMKVYGTKFDIRANKKDSECNIVLVEGKISMIANNDFSSKEVFLAPYQKATLKDGNTNFEINDVENIETYTSWIEGYLTFINEDVNSLLKKVSRYYGVEIEVNEMENIDKIFGKLDLKDDIEKVLDGIAFISKTKYKKNSNKYVFYN